MIDENLERNFIEQQKAATQKIMAKIDYAENKVFRTLAKRRLPEDATEEEIIEKIKEIQIEIESKPDEARVENYKEEVQKPLKELKKHAKDGKVNIDKLTDIHIAAITKLLEG